MTLLRSLLFLVWFVFVSAVMFVGALPLLAAPRRAVLGAARLWVRLVLFGLKIFCGQSFTIRGKNHVPHGAALIAAKHFSMWETMAFIVLVDDPAVVLKRNLMWIPLYGWYASKMRMIPVDRLGKANALRAMRRASRDAVAARRQIVIFPEGTRRKLGDPPAYRPGVAGLYADLGVPCVPVAHNSGLFWTKGGWIKRPGTIVVEFLPVIAPGLKRENFMRELETRIEGAVGRLLGEATDV